MFMEKAIVITTVNSPTKGCKQFAKLPGFSLVVAGDNTTPHNWNINKATFLTILDQKKKYPKLFGLVAQNHYARKNFAYLEAILAGVKQIFETDDDNIPYSSFPNFVNKNREIIS